MRIVAIPTVHAVSTTDPSHLIIGRRRKMMTRLMQRLRWRRTIIATTTTRTTTDPHRILGRTPRQPIAPPSTPHPPIAVMHRSLPMRQSAPTRHFSRIPSLVAVRIREGHARHAMGTGGSAPRIVLEASAIIAPLVGGARPVGDFGGGGSGGFDVAVGTIAAVGADGQLGYRRQLGGGVG